MVSLALWLSLLAVAVADGSSAWSISAVSARLPSEKAESQEASSAPIAVSMVVSAAPGCFEWSSRDPSVVNVTLQDDARCNSDDESGSALITSVHNSTNLTDTEVLATQEDKDVVLAVEVYVAPIHEIQILTTVRRLPLFEEETLQVQAFDETGNVFSSLNGLGFQWTTMLEANPRADDSKTPLAIQRISESRITPIMGLEQEYFGRFGFKIGVIGKVTGRALVKSELVHVAAGGIGEEIFDIVAIDVVETIELCPGDAILIPGVDIAPRARRKVSYDRFEALTKSHSRDYEWVLQGGDGALEVNEKTGVLHAVEKGRAKLHFQQRDYTTNKETAILQVIEPESLGLWLASVETNIDSISLLGPGECEFLEMARFPLDRRLPKEKKWLSSQSGTKWFMVVGRLYFVMITLEAEALEKGKMFFISDNMDFRLEDRVSSSSPEGKIELRRDLTEGVFKSNVAVLEGKTAGFVDLHATLGLLGMKTKKPEVQIVDPISLVRNVIRLPADTFARTSHTFAIEALGGSGQYRFDLINDLQVVVLDSTNGRLRVRKQVQANQTARVSDFFDDSNFDVAHVLVSQPSEIRFMDGAELLVAIGDRFPVETTILDKDGFPFTNCTALGKAVEWELPNSVIEIAETQGRQTNGSICSQRTFSAVKPGVVPVRVHYGMDLSATLRIRVLEQVRIDFPDPNFARIMVGTSTEVKIVGGKPDDGIMLIEDGSSLSTDNGKVKVTKLGEKSSRLSRWYKLKCLEEGKFDVRAQRRVTMVLICAEASEARVSIVGDDCPDIAPPIVVNNFEVPLRVDLLDAMEHEPFTDLSSFDISWDFDGGPSEQSTEMALDRDLRGEQTVGVQLKFLTKTFEANLAFRVVDDIEITPNPVGPLLASKDFELPITVTKGSDELAARIVCAASPKGTVSVVNTNSRDVAVAYNLGQRERLDAKLICTMKCLIGSRGSAMNLPFRDVASLRIEGPNKIRKQREEDISVRAFDMDGQAFFPSVLASIALSLSESDRFVEIVEKDRWDTRLRGVEEGEAIVRASIFDGALRVEYKIKVYKGLKILPFGGMKTVEPGVDFHLERRHGPFADPTNCRFEKVSKAVQIRNEKEGLFHAMDRPGEVVVRAICVEDGVIIDDDEIKVRVKVFSQVEIFPDKLEIVEGDSIRVRASFAEVENEYPIDFESIARTYEWSISEDQTVAKAPSSKRDYSIWVESLVPGMTELHLVAKSIKGHPELQTTVKVVVEPRMRLVLPSQILMPRKGEFSIKTSLDGQGLITYSACNENILSVDKQGRVRSGDRLGSVPVLVEYRGGLVPQVLTVLVLVREISFAGRKRDGSVGLFDENGKEFTPPISSVSIQVFERMATIESEVKEMAFREDYFREVEIVSGAARLLLVPGETAEVQGRGDQCVVRIGETEVSSFFRNESSCCVEAPGRDFLNSASDKGIGEMEVAFLRRGKTVKTLIIPFEVGFQVEYWKGASDLHVIGEVDRVKSAKPDLLAIEQVDAVVADGRKSFKLFWRSDKIEKDAFVTILLENTRTKQKKEIRVFAIQGYEQFLEIRLIAALTAILLTLICCRFDRSEPNEGDNFKDMDYYLVEREDDNNTKTFRTSLDIRPGS